jgi:hypothetical protein
LAFRPVEKGDKPVRRKRLIVMQKGMLFDIERFIGTWVSESGHRLKIEKMDDSHALVSFFSDSGEPVLRPYFNNAPTTKMPATYDDYEGDMEVHLWDSEKGFSLILTHEYDDPLDKLKRESLIPALSRHAGDDFLDQYYELFGPLSHYTRST